MVRPLLLLAVSIAVAGWLMVSLFSHPPQNGRHHDEETPAGHSALVVFCAASNRKVMQAIALDYQREYGIPVEFQFGPSQSLLSSIEVSQTGDLYLPADDSYLEIAKTKGLVDQAVPLARMHVVLGVKKGNPKSIRRFEDLLKPDIRLVQANPKVAAVGKLTRESLSQQGKWDALQMQTLTFVSTVTEAANSVSAGAADVAIVYDAILTDSGDLEIVEIEEFRDTFADVKIGLIQSNSQRDLSLHFVRYLSASDRGLRRYREFGLTPVDGRPWSAEPLP